MVSTSSCGLVAAAVLILAVPARANAQPTDASGTPRQSASDGQPSSAAAPDAALDGVVFGIGFDGYYAWNTNRPVGRINLLRAYDVSSNSFSLNQANVIVEPRPQVYRNVFQAYGTYLVPVGSGLQVDFGKFASALGFENNYTKDQINYSRSYFFDYLPFYHFGLRSTYALNARVSLTYWLVNGAQQSEDFNGFKSQALIVTLKPSPSIAWNVNYYAGREARDLGPALNPGLPDLPTQPGLSADRIAVDRSRLHIVDTYASWTKSRVLLGGELDYVALRSETSASAVVTGGAGYAQYRVNPQVQLALRGAYFADRVGLFSGTPQHLHELTATATYQVADGMMLRGEWRRDASDRFFFLGPTLDDRRRAQQTLTAGLVWWFGSKRGVW